eukprot:12937943-Prorocentrum_lima.AAC.1
MELVPLGPVRGQAVEAAHQPDHGGGGVLNSHHPRCDGLIQRREEVELVGAATTQHPGAPKGGELLLQRLQG